MKLFVLFFSLLLFVSPSVAQTNVQEICGYKTELDRVLKRQPNYLILQNALFEQAMQELAVTLRSVLMFVYSKYLKKCFPYHISVNQHLADSNFEAH